MKRIYNLYIISLLMLGLVGCSEEDILKTEHTGKLKNTELSVVVEDTQSRSVVDISGNYYWSTNDCISVFGSKSNNIQFGIQNGSTKETVFWGNLMDPDEKILFSFFPYGEDVKFMNDNLLFELPAERNLTQTNSSPMLGFIGGDNKLHFYHAGGVLCLRILGLSENITSLEVEASGENAPYLSGTAIIDKLQTGNTYTIQGGSHKVVYNMMQANRNEQINLIYLPLQVGNYGKLTISIKDNTGAVVDSRKISDLKVTRGSMTMMPVLNFSTETYLYQLPKEYIENTNYIDAFVSSDQMFIGVDTLGGNLRNYSICNIGLNQSDSFQSMTMSFDNDGWMKSVTFDQHSMFFKRNDDNTVNVICIFDGKIEEYTNIQVELPKKSRAVETTSSIFHDDYSTQVSWLTTIGSMGTLSMKFVAWGAWLLGSPISGAISDRNLRLVVGSVASIVGAGITLATTPVTLTALSIAAIAAAGYSFVTGVYGLFESAKLEAYTWIFEKVCGNATPVTLTPMIVDDLYCKVGYRINNYNTAGSSEEHKLLKNWFKPQCGLIEESCKKGETIDLSKILVNIGYFEKDWMTDMNNLTKTEFWFEDIYLTDNDSYYRSYITFEGFHNVANYGNIEKLSMDASIENIRTYPFYSDGTYCFAITVECQSGGSAVPLFLNLYHDGEVIDIKPWNSNNNQVEFDIDVPKSKMDLRTMTPSGKYAIGISTVKGATTNLLAQKLLDLKYDSKATLKIESVKIGQTVTKNESRANNEDEYYETEVTVVMSYTGGGMFHSYKIKTSNGDLWEPKYNGIYFEDYNELKLSGTVIYGKNQAPPTLTCLGVSHDKNIIEGSGCVTFQGIPIEGASIN